MPRTPEENAAQQVRAGGPDPQQTKGDGGPGAPTAAPTNVPGTVGWSDTRGTGRRFVVRHSFVDGFTRGQVVSESKFRKDADFDRLLALEAVREATGEESGLDQVTQVDPEGPNPSYEALMSDKERQIEQLRTQVAELQRKQSARLAAAAGQRDAEQGAQAASLVAEKDARIRHLEAENERLKATGAKADPGQKK